MALETHDTLKNLSNRPDIGFQYQDNGQPWASIIGAHSGVPSAFHAPGKIRFIDFGDNKGPIEYWYKGGVALENLVPRYENLDSAQSYVTILEGLRAETLGALNLVNEIKEQVETVANTGLILKGPYNPSTNTPPLTETPDASWPDGSYLDISPVGGILAFAGENFLAGQQVTSGDILKKFGNKWSWVKNSTVANAVNTSIELSGTNLNYTKGVNLFNVQDPNVALGNFVNYTSGLLNSSANYNATGFIPVVAGQTYTLSFKHQIAWYDAAKVYMSGSNSTDTTKTQTAPAGAAYLRCSVNLLSWALFQVVKGSVELPFEKFMWHIGTKEGAKIYADNALRADLADLATVANTLNPSSAVSPYNIGLLPEKNLFNINDPNNIIGSFIDHTEGILLPNANYNTSHFIPVGAGESLVMSNSINEGGRLLFFRADKTFISGVSTPVIPQVTPANTAYVRMSLNASTASWATLQLEKGLVKTAFSSFKYVFSKLSGTEIKIPDYIVKSTDLGLVRTKNLFDIYASDIALSNFVNYTTGLLNVNPSYNATGFIPVVAGQTYTLSYKHQIAWYNAAKTYLSGSDSADTNKTQTAPVGAAYLRCSVNPASWEFFQVVLGAVALPYQPYGYYFEKFNGVPVYANPLTPTVSTAPVSDSKILIAPKYYVPRGKEIAFYPENVSKFYESEARGRIDIAIPGGTIYGRNTRFTPATLAPVTVTVKLYDREYMNPVTITADIIPVDETKTGALKVLHIGDSLTRRSSFANVLLNSPVKTGITHLGMRKSADTVSPIFTEGRGGWALSTYSLPNTSLFNPFAQPQDPYKYYGNTSYWAMSVHDPNEYESGLMRPEVISKYGSNGQLIAPEINDLMFFNADSTYKKWNGTAWETVPTGSLTFTFNYPKYRALYSFPVADVIHFMLFTNDFSWQPITEMPFYYNEFKIRLNAAIASFKADNPAIKIIIAIAPNSGKQGPDGVYETEKRKNSYFTAAKNLITDYSNREGENLYVVDYRSVVDRIYGYTRTDILPFAAYTGAEREKYMADYSHMSLDGFDQMGALYMGIIQALR